MIFFTSSASFEAELMETIRCTIGCKMQSSSASFEAELMETLLERVGNHRDSGCFRDVSSASFEAELMETFYRPLDRDDLLPLVLRLKRN